MNADGRIYRSLKTATPHHFTISFSSHPLGTINTGLVFGFSAVVIPQLKKHDSDIPINDVQSSWIGE